MWTYSCHGLRRLSCGATDPMLVLWKSLTSEATTEVSQMERYKVVFWPSRAQVRTATKQGKWKRTARSRNVTKKCEPPGLLPTEERRPEGLEAPLLCWVWGVWTQITSLPSAALTELLDCPPLRSCASGKSKLTLFNYKSFLTPLNCIPQLSQCFPFSSESNHLIISYEGEKKSFSNVPNGR